MILVVALQYSSSSLDSFLQHEIASSFASNASLVHKQVVRTDEGRKRYREQVRSVQ